MTAGAGTSGGRAVQLIGVVGIGPVAPGDDLAHRIVTALSADGEGLRDDDVLVVSSKVISKAQGRLVAAQDREALIAAETVRVVAERNTGRGVTRVVQSRSGPVLAAAGVDASNVAPGHVLLLPTDPDDAARQLRRQLRLLCPARIGVVISDTAGRAWRDGQVDLAIGAAGVRVVDDLRGVSDAYGNRLEVTVRALADELAAAADLVKGKLRAVPVALLRGLADAVTDEDGPGAAVLLRRPAADWFALGHVEAVRSALGAPPGTPGVGPAPLELGDVPQRLARAVQVALAGPGPIGAHDVAVVFRSTPLSARLSVTPCGPSALLALGATAQRVVSAGWAEGLRIEALAAPDLSVVLTAELAG